MKKTFLLFIVCVFAFVGCTSKTIASDVLSWQEQYDLGVRYLNEGNYEEAIIAFTAAIEIDEKNTAAYLGRAEAYMNSDLEKGIENALADYNTVLELDSGCEDAYLGMAKAYIKLGDYDKAREALERVSDESLKAGILAEIEKNTTDAELEFPEIEIEDYSYEFEAVNEGDNTVGNMCISAKITAPNVSQYIRIASFGHDISSWSKSKINENVMGMIKLWENADDLSLEMQQPPYEITRAYLVSEEMLGKNVDVLLVGFDDEYNPIGYKIVTTQVPEVVEKPEPVQVTVTDAVNYSRKINLRQDNYMLVSSDLAHSVRIPKISGESEGIKKLNEKILNKFEWVVTELKNGSIRGNYHADNSLDGDNALFQLEYEYSTCGNTVAILAKLTTAVLPGGANNYQYFYYFDVEKDAEISFEEYLKKHGISHDRFNEAVMEKKREMNYPEYISKFVYSTPVENAVVYDDKILILIEREMGFDYVTIDRSAL